MKSLPSTPKPLRTRNPKLAAKIQQMALSLAPLVSLASGNIHPCFPLTLLNYWLLTSAQLDELAHFYHQRTPGPYSSYYPCPVYWDCGASLEEKRRRLGRFIGLRGCESPVWVGGNGHEERVHSIESIEREVRREREVRAEEEEFMRRKARWH